MAKLRANPEIGGLTGRKGESGSRATAAFETLSCQDRPLMDREEAEEFLRRLSGLPWTRREPVGLGFEAGGSDREVSAGALFLGGALVHLSAVARPEPLLLEAPHPARP